MGFHFQRNNKMQSYEEQRTHIMELIRRSSISPKEETKWRLAVRRKHYRGLHDALVRLRPFEIDEILVEIFQVESCLFPMKSGVCCRNKVSYGAFCQVHQNVLNRLQTVLEVYCVRDVAEI